MSSWLTLWANATALFIDQGFIDINLSIHDFALQTTDEFDGQR